MGFSDSEMYKNLKELFRKYKDFAFKGVSQIPYSAVPAWKSFADGRIEEALKEDMGIWQNIKDFYVITILSTIASMIGFWYLTLLLGGLLIALLGFGVILGILFDPLATLTVLAAVILFLLLVPGITLLLQGLLVHGISKIFGGKGSYSQTLSVLVVGSGAALALMIPMYIAYALVVGFFISPLSYAIYLFVIYLQYKGIKYVHQLSSERAAAVVIGSVVIGVLIYIMFAVVVEMIRLALELVR